MATVYPENIQHFPQMQNITVDDASLVQQYQEAMLNEDIITAKQLLAQISDNQSKIITADYLNTINDTVEAVEQYFLARYSPAYIVSQTQPLAQEKNDFWFQVV